MSTAVEQYQGLELDLFSHAVHWKSYWSSYVRPYLNGKVLEVGAGNGNNVALLCNSTIAQWTCVEPDRGLASEIEEKAFPRAKKFETVVGTLDAVVEKEFDVVLYIDVLEHIEQDRAEVQKAAEKLKSGGTLIILSPSHNALYSEFDKSIGHFRRYNRNSLRACIPVSLKEMDLLYLDSVGLFASLANRLVLKKPYPSSEDIHLWDSWMVPISRVVDRVTFNQIGKSILGVWKKR